MATPTKDEVVVENDDEDVEDQMLVGYQFGSYSYTSTDGVRRDRTPYDYVTDQATGLRPGDVSKRPPNGVSKIDLRQGVKDYHTLPPVEVWNAGMWFFKLSQPTQNSLDIVKQDEEWDAWCVPGEGTPGNFILRVYIIPDDVSAYTEPEHPMFWDEKIRAVGNNKGTTGTTSVGGYGFAMGKPASTSPPKPPPLPVGIRFRCRGCGHFFREADFAGHNTHCCPANAGPEGSDWVIQCECHDELVEVSACLPGFPLDRKEAPSEDEASGKPTKEKEVVPA